VYHPNKPAHIYKNVLDLMAALVRRFYVIKVPLKKHHQIYKGGMGLKTRYAAAVFSMCVRLSEFLLAAETKEHQREIEREAPCVKS
jgi:hypothetical protein